MPGHLPSSLRTSLFVLLFSLPLIVMSRSGMIAQTGTQATFLLYLGRIH